MPNKTDGKFLSKDDLPQPRPRTDRLKRIVSYSDLQEAEKGSLAKYLKSRRFKHYREKWKNKTLFSIIEGR